MCISECHASASLGVREDDRHYQQTRPMHECACALMERMEATLQLQQALGEEGMMQCAWRMLAKYLVPSSSESASGQTSPLGKVGGLEGSSQQEGELPPALALEPGVS